MVRGLSRKDKRGVSIMIGYVLLIVIAISLSVMVFAYLRLYLPGERLQCPEDVHLVIAEASCSGGNVLVTIENRGLRSVERAYIRFGQAGRLHKTNLGGNPANFENLINRTLNPGDSTGGMIFELPSGYAGFGEGEIEVQPVMIIKKELVVCPSVSTRMVECA
jgi:hypothetical protein